MQVVGAGMPERLRERERTPALQAHGLRVGQRVRRRRQPKREGAPFAKQGEEQGAVPVGDG